MLRMIGRFAPYAPLYYEICEDNYRQYQRDRAELIERKKQSPKHWDDLIVCGQAALNHGTKSVIFAGLCLEAFIYDYAARRFSNSYVDNFLDKLNLVAKWVVIPKLVLDKEFPRDTQAFERLVKLKKARDSYVHAKSKQEPASDEERARMLEELEEKETENFENSYIAVKEVLAQLRELEEDDQRGKWWALI